jgi:hypothetical protein
MNAPERFEQLIAFLSATLPAPVEQHAADDGSVLFTGGSPGEVVVHLTETSVIVAEYAGQWDTRYAFRVRPRRVGMLKWRRLPEPALMNALAQLIGGARDARRARYRICRFCDVTNPPEWMDTDEVCVGCTEQQQRVVH